MIHTVKVFGIVNKAKTDVFLKLSCFFHDPADVGNQSYPNMGQSSLEIVSLPELAFLSSLLIIGRDSAGGVAH